MTTRQLDIKRVLDRDERAVGRRQVVTLGAAVLFGRVVTACSAALHTGSSASGTGRTRETQTPPNRTRA